VAIVGLIVAGGASCLSSAHRTRLFPGRVDGAGGGRSVVELPLPLQNFILSPYQSVSGTVLPALIAPC